MEILIRNNSVYLKNANLGKGFADMTAQSITINQYGKVKVFGSKLSFLTDLDRIPVEILDAVSQRLEKEVGNRILERIKEKIQRTQSIE